MAASAIPGLDVTEIDSPDKLPPYRNPRDALRKGPTVKPSAIPGLDVGEIDRVQPNPAPANDARAGAAAARAGTATPASVSARAGVPPATSAAPDIAAPAQPGVVSRAANIARSAVVPALGVAAYNAAGSALSDQTPSTPGIQPTGRPNVDAIPGAAPGDVAPPQQAPNFYRDSEVGRNVSNTINALGAGGAASSAVRGGINVVNAVRAGSTAEKVAGIASNTGQAIAAVNAVQPTVSTVPVANAAPRPSVPPAAPDVGVGPSAQAAIDAANAVLSAPPGTNDATEAPVNRAAPQATAAPADVTGIYRRTSEINNQIQDVAKGLDQYGPGGGGGGPAVSIGGDSIAKHNAEVTRNGILDTLLNASKSGNSRSRAAALQAYAGLAGQFAGNDNGLDIARLRDGGDTARNAATNQTAITREQIGSKTATRGQDIGAQTAAAANETALQREKLGNQSAQDVARISSEGRIEAAINKGQRPVVVPGGQMVQDINGLPQVVTVPSRVFDPNSGKFIEQPTSGATAAAPPTAAIAKLKSDPALAAEFDAKYGKGAAAAALQSK